MILFDQGTPVPLRRYLCDHDVETAFERGWSHLRNGTLLDRLEAEGFELLITTDQSLHHQQNLAKRPFSVLVLMSTSWPQIEKQVKKIVDAIERITPSEYVQIQI
ncbi:MAG: hypothetical protein OXC63_05185 [Aestuariivita sp.]|nr:hypothetical protein [Aestuariivita sp.]